jgi:hypothetical protein
MIIPNKFSGFHNGVRRCFGGPGGGGGDGAGDGVGDGTGPGPGPGDAGGGGGNTANTSINTNTGNTGNTVFNTNRGSVTGMNFTGTGNTAGTSTIPSNNLNLQNMYGKPYNQSGQQYNALLQQGYTGNDIRNALTTNGRPVSDSDYGYLVQNAGMTSPTSRPYAGSDQFFQPVYNTSYQNYARPTTQFDTSTYGTQPVYSPARAWNDRNSGSAAGGQQVVNNAIGNYFQQNPNSDINSTLAAMRSVGINRTDIQAAGGYNNYGPQMSMPSMQAQQPFNPYSNNSGFNGQLMTAGYGGFGSPMGGLSPFVTNSMYQMQQPYNPFSYQQQSYQPQMQTPFSYQPSYGGYDNYGGDFGGGFNMYTPVTQQPTPQRTSSGPTTPIVGRSSQMRGTPNVMRRAEGGIASLMDDVE